MRTTRTTGRQAGQERWALDLERNATLRLPHRAGGQWLRVERGQVLVTLEGERDDMVLEAGEELVLAGHGRAGAWALEASRVTGGVVHGARVLRTGPEAAAA